MLRRVTVSGGNETSVQGTTRLIGQVGIRYHLHRSYSAPAADLVQRRPRCAVLRACGYFRSA
eukprot:7871363-Pyramimonas_sp.AAC.1